MMDTCVEVLFVIVLILGGIWFVRVLFLMFFYELARGV
jgi:hypothetical protein